MKIFPPERLALFSKMRKQPIAMTIKSFGPLFSKSGQGQGAAAPCRILKGEAL